MGLKEHTHAYRLFNDRMRSRQRSRPSQPALSSDEVNRQLAEWRAKQNPPQPTPPVRYKDACEVCGDRHGPWGLDDQKRFLCEVCLEGPHVPKKGE